jgi:predicted RNA-binding Zn-ribbon protein involved in translation (DUF1610 family)
MICPKCKFVEMRVDRVDDTNVYYKCKKCGEEKTETIKEIEERNKDE